MARKLKLKKQEEMSSKPVTITVASGYLKVPPAEVYNYLQELGWVYKNSGSFVANQEKIKMGLLEHADVKEQILITRNGVVKLSQIFAINMYYQTAKNVLAISKKEDISRLRKLYPTANSEDTND